MKELGILPIRFIIKARRLNYLYYLATKEKNSMLYRVFKLQWLEPEKGDWSVMAKADLEEVGLTLEDIERISKYKFKKIVK